jgi:Fic family protein
MPTYIHQRPDWPALTWDAGAVAEALVQVRHRQGLLLGRMGALGFDLQAEAGLSALTREVVMSSAIEGERLNPDEVRSSIARRLGLDAAGLPEAGRAVEGIVEMMLDATRNCSAPLTEERLYAWHAALFPTGRSGGDRITVGAWRTETADPMRVVSGAIGREKVHFEAPEAARVPEEMRRFLAWFNQPAAMDPVVKAALAHLWFVTIHPFEDGNGRMARAIADMALSRGDNTRERFYSMSAQIEVERRRYYHELERAQQGDLAVTAWMVWFLECLGRAMDRAEEILSAVLRKARVWQRLTGHSINERQRVVLQRLLDGFAGNLTSSKYAKLAKCSPDTALRDIQGLIGLGVLVQNPAGGRSTSYGLANELR